MMKAGNATLQKAKGGPIHMDEKIYHTQSGKANIGNIRKK